MAFIGNIILLALKILFLPIFIVIFILRALVFVISILGKLVFSIVMVFIVIFFVVVLLKNGFNDEAIYYLTTFIVLAIISFILKIFPFISKIIFDGSASFMKFWF